MISLRDRDGDEPRSRCCSVGQRHASRTIVDQQQAGLWNVLPLFLSFFIFLVAAFAETNRLPFDLPEAESELIAGYHTEYSAMKFSLFFIAEYANMVTVVRDDGDAVLRRLGHSRSRSGTTRRVACCQTLRRRGGLLASRCCSSIFVFMWIRWTLPRFRYDQLMSLGWKVMLPMALAYIMVMSRRDLRARAGRWASPSPVLASLALFGAQRRCSVILVFVLLDRGRLHPAAPATGSSARLQRARRAPGARRGGGLMAIGVKVIEAPERAGQLRARHAQGHGAHLQAHARAEGHDAVPGGEEHRPRAWTGISPRWRGTHRMLTDEQGRPSAWPAASARRSAPPTASSWCRARTRRATAIRWSTRSTSSAASSAATARRSAPRRRSTSGVHYENSEYSRDRFVYDLERLIVPDPPGVELWDPADPQGRVDARTRSGLLHLRGCRGGVGARCASSAQSPWRRRSGWWHDVLAGGALRAARRAVHRRDPGAGVRRRDHGAVPLRDHAAQPRRTPSRHARTRRRGHRRGDRRSAGDRAGRAAGATRPIGSLARSRRRRSYAIPPRSSSPARRSRQAVASAGSSGRSPQPLFQTTWSPSS